MFEADALCDRIAVINKGEIVAHGTPAQLKQDVAEGAGVGRVSRREPTLEDAYVALVSSEE